MKPRTQPADGDSTESIDQVVPWWLYALACRGGGIYWGIAKNVEQRFHAHVYGKGALYTRLNPPIEIIARREFRNHHDAAREERRVKQMRTEQRFRYLQTLVERSGLDPIK